MGIEHLVERYPRLKRTLPIAPLGAFPTPVERAPGLDGDARGAQVWIKRDDRSGRLYGGNKIRKLELLMGRARADRRTWLATTGAWGSHHTLATTLAARAFGLRVCAVLYPQPATEHVLDVFLHTAANGATLRLLESPARAPLALAYESLRRGAMSLPPGGSTPQGALGYAAAGLELAEQVVRGECPCPARIYVPLGTGGTCAGLLLGLRIANLDTRLVAVRVSPRLGAGPTAALAVTRLAMRASKLLHGLAPKAPLLRFERGDLDILDSQVGEGYGHPTPAAEAAVSLAAEKASTVLELTYTGKTLAGLLDDLTLRPTTGPILFWNTLSSVDLGPPPPPAVSLPIPLLALYKNRRSDRISEGRGP